ncbi:MULTISPECIES: ABC transporter permease DevC [unclassified Nodularia (in: cyanobacteria)]|uniref:ABC transporter permease DevC n=1 Tax=unclassified Nodularia (in: cyanobacteria) TaxID=2656917 RepID=UPI001882CA98|nr:MULTISPECIES: ABC transporter permease DevC [unclassified Nodularia (in: cyanobacteria)]MBE9198903.1 lipid ABC transporter permease [Nodularia sp. LEGE 06071]MCC2692681.1 lipid ABC transporter permease [Nodularia sp. LEGE 04288]
MRVFLFKISLSWRNLVFNKQRFIAALAAIAFAVFLMFIQIGFRNAMLNSSVRFIQYLNADLIMINKQRYVSFVEETFPKTRLYQAQSFAEVEAAYPFYIGIAMWKNQESLSERGIRVFGLDLNYSTFSIPHIQKYRQSLYFPDTLLADTKSRHEFGQMRVSTTTELSGRKIEIIGLFELGTDFMADGNLITSDQNFYRIFAGKFSWGEGNIRTSLHDVDLGLIKLKKGINPEKIANKLNDFLPKDVIVLAKSAFINRELKYWDKATPIGFVFTLGTIIGFIVGSIIVYDIIFNDIGDNLVQYAMLKAIGYSNSYFKNIVILQSLILAILGFIPGLYLSIIIYQIASVTTGLLLKMDIQLIIIVLLSTISMCILSGIVAVRKLQLIAPAEVYSQKN